MKKYNEGYALPFVLVVSIVMCLIAVTVMSFSLKNLQTQQAFVDRMQAKYAAAAAIEEIYACALSGEKGNFPGNDGLKFCILSDSNILRIASGGQSENKNQTVWIAAAFKIDESAKITNCISIDGGELRLGNNIPTIQYASYGIVDEAAAMEFVEESNNADASQTGGDGG